jgi:hypothetical protein
VTKKKGKVAVEMLAEAYIRVAEVLPRGSKNRMSGECRGAR